LLDVSRSCLPNTSLNFVGLRLRPSGLSKWSNPHRNSGVQPKGEPLHKHNWPVKPSEWLGMSTFWNCKNAV